MRSKYLQFLLLALCAIPALLLTGCPASDDDDVDDKTQAVEALLHGGSQKTWTTYEMSIVLNDGSTQVLTFDSTHVMERTFNSDHTWTSYDLGFGTGTINGQGTWSLEENGTKLNFAGSGGEGWYSYGPITVSDSVLISSFDIIVNTGNSRPYQSGNCKLRPKQ